MNVDREVIDRTLAERVMGWTLEFGDPLVDGCDPSECWYVKPGPPLEIVDFDAWNPSTSEADFAECFAKLPQHKQSEAIELWAESAGYFRLQEDGHEAIIAWQLGSIPEKARCLYEVVMEQQPERKSRSVIRREAVMQGRDMRQAVEEYEAKETE